MTTLALVGWPILILILARRFPLPHLILIALIGGYLLLPTEGGWDFPLIPPLDKYSIPAFTVFLAALTMYRSPARGGAMAGIPSPASLDLPGWLPKTAAGIVPLVMIVVGAFATVATNGDRLFYGPRVVSALRPYDAFSITMLSMVTLLPLFLGRKYFAHPDRHRLLLHGLVVAAVAYSFLALFEIRMSPQLNNMVYGYFPHSWAQHARAGGWRPLVFLWHGLALAIFFSMAILAAFGSARFAPPERKRFYMMAGGWLLMTLLLSNSLGALLIALFLLLFIFMADIRGKLTVSAIIAVIALSYPALRNIDVIPTERLVNAAATISEDRSRSLNFRFEQEDALLEHARERPLFGWGTFGRNRLYDNRGRNISVTDGLWVITFGKGGWVGYLAEFGLLTLPLVLLAFRARRIQVAPETALLALVLAAHLIDLLPNGFISPVTWLIAGAMLGRLEYERIEATEPIDSQAAADPRQSVYARAKPSLSGGFGSRDKDGAPVYSRQTQKHQRPERAG